MHLLTDEGREKLVQELTKLKTKREQARQTIASVKDFGDIAENSEFEDAKNELSFLESRIAEIERTLAISGKVIISDCSKVSPGCKVKVRADGETFEYQIVSPAEADPARGKISDSSPLGKTLIDHKKGDSIEVNAPGGTVKYQITSIEI